jgi:hypothetical protein
MAEKESLDELRVDAKELLEHPYTDEDGMIDLLLSDDDGPGITDAHEQMVDVLIKKEAADKTEENPVITPPMTLPASNLGANALTLNVRKNSTLAKFIGNPIENDNLIDTIRKDASTASVLNAVMEEIAEEIAFLKAWRNENWDGEMDLSEATFKRVRMLKDLVDTILEKEKLKKEKNIGKIDFYGESFQSVLKYFLEIIQKTFKKVNIPVQFENIFFAQLAKEFDGFEKAVEKIYYAKDG